jgi:hypothetical protein
MIIGKFGGRMNTISFNVMKKCPNDNVESLHTTITWITC